MSWYARWKSGKAPEFKKPEPEGPRVMSPSEEVAWLREKVLSKGPKDNPPFAESAKRLAELYAELYPGNEDDNAR